MLLIFKPKHRNLVPDKKDLELFEELCNGMGINLKSGHVDVMQNESFNKNENNQIKPQ